jgi:hypothetical protein
MNNPCARQLGIWGPLLGVVLVAACGGEPVETKQTEDPPAEEPLLAEEWLTVAEQTGFRATSSYDQTLELLRRLEARMPEVKVETFGVSGQGREIPLVILSGDRAFDPLAAARTGKPIVMIQNGIHPGEIDGKDACLMLLRDLLFGERRYLLDAAVVLIVPILNVDGHERVSPVNRANQDGPAEGMGYRATARGLDLNRDHVKAVSPEMRALIGLFNKWQPHLHVDVHVTDGSDHDWVLTTVWCEEPIAAPSIDAWYRASLPPIQARVEQLGHRNGPYVWLKDRNDPSKGFSTTMATPRYSTTYFTLRQRPAILVETHSFKPFEQRVLATRDFLAEVLREVGEHPQALIAAVDSAARRMTELGAPDAAASAVALTYKDSDETDSISFPIYKSRLEPSVVTGKPLIRYERGVLDEQVVPWTRKALPKETVPRPRGYLVLRGWTQIEELLDVHGLEVEQLKEPVELEVVTARLSNPRYEPESYQGEIRTAVDVEHAVEQRSFPAGTLWIPASQPGFEVAVHMLEPDGPDSLVKWGLLRSVLERKVFIGPRGLEDEVAELLKDPAVEQEWNSALEDPKFAADDKARYVWWYERTKYWDEQVGLLPAMRVMTRPAFATEPWSSRGARQR